jgi:hypothetical protein
MFPIQSAAVRCTTACCVALAASFCVTAARANNVLLDAGCAPRLTVQQQRLFDRASVGTDALRQFIYIRRAILQVDTYETAIWASDVAAAHAACVRRLSGSGPSEPPRKLGATFPQ